VCPAVPQRLQPLPRELLRCLDRRHPAHRHSVRALAPLRLAP
jgi:hypothetical protein